MNVFQRIRGSGGGGGKGGGGSSGGKEAKNTLRSKATLKIVDLLGEGEIRGLVNGPRSIYFDNTPLMNERGDWNFDGVNYYFRAGLPDQSFIPGFTAIEAETGVGVQLKHNNPQIKTISDPDYTAATVTVRVPSLAQTNDEGDINPNSVSFSIRVRYQGGAWINPFGGQLTISGKCTAPYDRQYYFQLPTNPSGPSAPWEIEVVRNTPDSESVKNQNDIVFASYKGLIEQKFSYPYSAVIGIVIDAEEFGNAVPQRLYDVYGRIINVPSNYNPTTRTYSGIWDGTFKEEWTDNPAWVFYDLLTNDRFGLGDFILPEQVDKWGLYEIAQYCDELVPNGYGGQEPRMTFNGVIGNRREAYEAISDIASCFRGMAFWTSGSIVASQDSPKDPVVLAHPSNVIDGIFDGSTSGLKARHTVAMVRWNDPADLYRNSVEVVQNDEGIRRFGYRDTQIVATGCTSRGQAHRVGLWTLLSELFETETITYKAGLDHAGVRPGDIVAVQNPNVAGNDFGGRLAQGSTLGQLELDHEVTFEAGKTYSISVQMPDGKIEERDVVPVAFDTPTTTAFLSSNLSVVPDPQTMWVITSSTAAPQLFRVVAIREVEPHIYEVTGLEYEPAKFDAVDFGTKFEELDISDLPSGELPVPEDLRAQEYLLRNTAGRTISAVNLSTKAPNDPRVTRWEWQLQIIGEDGEPENWSQSAFSDSPNIDIEGIENAVYNIRVRHVSIVAGFSSWRVRTGISFSGLFTPPADVIDFRVNVVGDKAQFTWNISSELNVEGYEIRHSPFETGVTWNSAVIVAPNISGRGAQLPAIKGTYLIRAINSKGVYSVNDALIYSGIDSTSTFNAVEVFEEAPAFAGTHLRTVVVDNELRLASADMMIDWETLADVGSLYPGAGVEPSGIYTLADTLDLGAVFTSRITARVDAYGLNYSGVMADWVTLASVEAMAGSTSDLWDINLLMRTTEQDPADEQWTPWATFVSGDYSFRAVQFAVELISYNPKVTPSIRALTINVDMPDRIVKGTDLVVPVEGLFVPFSPPLKRLLGLGIADQDMLTGDKKLLTTKDEFGFFIQYLNSSGTPISRTFDYTAVGYGQSSSSDLTELPPGVGYIVDGDDYIMADGYFIVD